MKIYTRSELLELAKKPILFNTEMVKAISDGRKSVTRRIVKSDISNKFDIDTDGTAIAYIDQATGDSYKPIEIAPYKVGDILYIRETWAIQGIFANMCMMIRYKADNFTNIQIQFSPDRFEKFQKFYEKIGWIPALFMPKEAARTFLKVTSVRTERLQDITEEDATKEGAYRSFEPGKVHSLDKDKGYYKSGFRQIWDSTVDKKDLDRYGWKVNPWVWVIEFEKCKVQQE